MLHFYSMFILLSFVIAREQTYFRNYMDIGLDSETQEVLQNVAPEKRTVNTDPVVDIAEYPFIAAIISSGQIVTCSGIIVKPKWLLTAGHCITGLIRTVAYNYANPAEVQAKIVKTVKHPQYKMIEVNGLVTTLHHDLGLIFYNITFKLEITEPVSFKFRSAMKLLDSNAVSYGYGMERENGVAGVLRKLEVTLTECYNENWKFFICGRVLTPNSSGGVCPGDSGGPVVANDFNDYSLIGMNSLGPPLCTSDVPQTDPSAFVDIYKYMSWIDTILLLYDAEFSNLAACLKCERKSYVICSSLLLYCVFIKFR